ncbi:hypothetical protein ABL78_4162 [Leptomonas seymouri]|uniref:Uncharacterized protein n=1 Tax=Leptomonas seymouri TaxID=5684 RepID=A0A0N1HYL2_LEPSE|nr:hypothetical protein ABL78_4162 [Leptomonas seymouri]|eukprot:KPI86745.1 hypothetical protein ABL78_4162 [Leptomonas seymouri]
MMSGPSLAHVFPSVAQSSNLLQYRALFQVFTYARVKKQSAELLARDAMTGGVVVPFCLPSNVVVSEAPFSAVSTQSSKQTILTADQQQQQQQAVSSEAEYSHVLLLPSSKCIGTLATLLADGFFNIAPLSSTAEKVRGAPYQHRSECEARDYFTLIELLYPDCFVAEALPLALLAMRRAEVTTPQASQSTRLATRDWKSPPVQDPRVGDDLDGEGAAGLARSPPPLPCTQNSIPTESSSREISVVSGLQSSAKSTATELVLDSFHLAGSSAAIPTSVPAGTMVPEVDPVVLDIASISGLLECRRSLATVLLSSLNESLHDVQYRELERSKSTGTVGATPTQSSEAAALCLSSEFLLTAKILLLSCMAASEVWRRQAVSAYEKAESSIGTSGVSQLPSPYDVLKKLFEQEEAIVENFTTVPVEDWVWGRDREVLAQWYDRVLGRLLLSAEAAGVHLDSFLQSSKSSASKQGEAVSRAPTLLLHRPSDGRPAMELNLSFVDTLNFALPLPVMPLQAGEVQLLLHPCVVRKTKTGLMVSSRGHELLFDSAASPTADFLQSCVTSACTSAMLQDSGAGLPVHFKRRFHELSTSEQRMIKAFLEDPQLFGLFLEKNAPMLARLTIWCEGKWPPLRGSPHNCNGDEGGGELPVVGVAATSNEGGKVAAQIKESVMLRRPFNAAVGRYVREMVVLNGFDQATVERWIDHICNDIAQDGAFSTHRATLAALVKFMALQNKWTWSPEVDALQKQYLL